MFVTASPRRRNLATESLKFFFFFNIHYLSCFSESLGIGFNVDSVFFPEHIIKISMSECISLPSFGCLNLSDCIGG